MRGIAKSCFKGGAGRKGRLAQSWGQVRRVPAEVAAAFHTGGSGQCPSASGSVATKTYLRREVGAGAVRMRPEWPPVLPCLWASKTSISGAQIISSSQVSFTLVVGLGSEWRAHSAVAPRCGLVCISRVGSRPALTGPGPASRDLAAVAHDPGRRGHPALPSGPRGGRAAFPTEASRS